MGRVEGEGGQAQPADEEGAGGHVPGRVVAEVGEAVAELVAVHVDLAAVLRLGDRGAVSLHDPVPVRHRHAGLEENQSWNMAFITPSLTRGLFVFVLISFHQGYECKEAYV